jgi:hypothetical protein
MSGWDPAASELVSLLSGTARGPRREGVFALWLVVRVAQDLVDQPPFPDRAVRRRLQALETRLSSLTVPPPLRRALAAALLNLREGRADLVPVLLAALVAPARDTTGAESAEAIARAARAARATVSRPG